MKRTSKFITMLIACIVTFESFCGLFNNAEAALIHEESAMTQYQFNKINILYWAAEVGAGNNKATDIDADTYPLIPTEITSEMISDKTAIALKYESTTSGTDTLSDNLLNAADAADIAIAIGSTGADPFCIAKNLAEELSLNSNDIEVRYTISMPAIKSANIDEEPSQTVVIKNGQIQQTEAELESIRQKTTEYNKKVYVSEVYKNVDDTNTYGGTAEDWEEIEDKSKFDFVFLSAKAILPDKTEYSLVVGKNDEYINNWYMIRTYTAPSEPETPAKFETELDYVAISGSEELEGKMSSDGSTFLPPYYDDDNSKKDADAIATIKSKTNEEIASTNGVALTTDGKANSEGWYYPDLNNKKVIAKKYPFDDYDNTKYNGIVKETVKLTGAEGGTDTQTPSIQWTFRRKTVEEKTNSDESKTVTITYNLPVDPDSIPDGWEPVYDSDGQTIHKITRTFKKGEEYDKDVTVKQNGTGVPNTTHVTITWPKEEEQEKLPTVLAKTGENSKYILIAIIAGLVIFAVIRYRKLKNKR